MPKSSGALRIVSLAPSTTETLFALGAGADVVGRSRYCDAPAEALAVPVVAGFGDVNWEALLAVGPTLVVGTPMPAAAEIEAKMRARGVSSFFAPSENIADVLAMLRELGARVGQVARATDLVATMTGELAGVAARGRERPPLRVALAFGLAPLVLAGPRAFASELIAVAGAHNVLTEGPAYAKVPLEHLVALDPDVILEAAFGEARGLAVLAEQPGWSTLRALKTGRLVSLTDPVVLRPGPRLALAARAFEAAIFPAR